METQSLIPSGEIKQEQCSEVVDWLVLKTTARPVSNFPFLREYIKQELDSQTWEKEADGENKSDMSPYLLFPDESSFLYCEKCQLKYEGGCPEHGAVVYIDNAEEGQGYSQDSSPQVQVADNKDRQVFGREKVEQSNVFEAHSDDVGIIPNGGCSTESDELFSVCEMSTDLYVAGTNYVLQSNVEIKAGQKIHTKEKPFSCDVCGAGFDYCSLLKRHKLTHTGEKPYKCDVCGLGFTQQGNLTKHKRTHTGEKPCKCDVCGLGFTQQGHVKEHKRTHTGEKPFKCDVCGLGFTQQGNLNDHKRTHTGEKSFKCDVCGLGFTRQGNLKRHKTTHT